MAEKTDVNFSDVRGIEECREEVMDIVEYLKSPEKYHQVGAKMPKGVLLTGRPGTGKTLLARAIAGEAGVGFFFSSGSEFDEVFVGVGAKRIRELFKQAKDNAPCVIFIDEIDAVGGTRKDNSPTQNKQSLNQLLVEMDGFEQQDNILVVAATNLPESLDKALKRAGRFDSEIHIPLPDIKGRTEIIKLYLDKIYYDASVDAEILARGTTGMSGADLANLINQAMLNAVKEGRTACTNHDLDIARDRILMGVSRKSMTITDEEKMNTALHEVGHTLAAMLTEGALPIHKVTILPRGQALGVTQMLPEKDQISLNRTEVLAQIDVAMGGRVAEEIFFGKKYVTTGCSSDMNSATQIVYHHVKSGMFDEMTGYSNLNSVEGVEGPEAKDLVDEVCNKILVESYNRVRELLVRNKKLMQKIANELVTKETLTREEIRAISGIRT